jgi:hypothetical protein
MQCDKNTSTTYTNYKSTMKYSFINCKIHFHFYNEKVIEHHFNPKPKGLQTRVQDQQERERERERQVSCLLHDIILERNTFELVQTKKRSSKVKLMCLENHLGRQGPKGGSSSMCPQTVANQSMLALCSWTMHPHNPPPLTPHINVGM